jgi:hypothetical protein
VWEAFEEVRTKLRKPLTDNACKLTVQELLKLKNKGEDPVACLNQSVQRGYSGVFPVNRNDGRNGSGHEPKSVVVSPEAKRKMKEADEAVLARFRRENDIRLGFIPTSGGESETKSLESR